MTNHRPHPLDALEATALALLAQIRQMKQPATTLTGHDDDAEPHAAGPQPSQHKAFGRPRPDPA